MSLTYFIDNHDYVHVHEQNARIPAIQWTRIIIASKNGRADLSLVASLSAALRPRDCEAVVLALRLALVPQLEVRDTFVVPIGVATKEPPAEVAHP